MDFLFVLDNYKHEFDFPASISASDDNDLNTGKSVWYRDENAVNHSSKCGKPILSDSSLGA